MQLGLQSPGQTPSCKLSYYEKKKFAGKKKHFHIFGTEQKRERTKSEQFKLVALIDCW
jgi:hypothetical protein